MEQGKEAMEELLDELKDYLGTVEEDMEGLEETGKADEHPIKHQNALDKIEKIEGQINDLEKVLDDQSS